VNYKVLQFKIQAQVSCIKETTNIAERCSIRKEVRIFQQTKQLVGSLMIMMKGKSYYLTVNNVCQSNNILCT